MIRTAVKLKKNYVMFDFSLVEEENKELLNIYNELSNDPRYECNIFVLAVNNNNYDYLKDDNNIIINKNTIDYKNYLTICKYIIGNKDYSQIKLRNKRHKHYYIQYGITYPSELRTDANIDYELFKYCVNGRYTRKSITTIVRGYKRFPLIVNILKKIIYEDEYIIIKSFCLTKGIRINNFDISKLKLNIADKEYPIQFKFNKGIPFIKKYCFNFYEIKIPIQEIVLLDIQNRLELNYDNTYFGRILYSVFDFLKGKNRNSRIIKFENKSIYLRQTLKNTMYLTVRETNRYDYFQYRIKLYVGYILSFLIIKPKLILLFEKESSRFEESASVLYTELIDKNYRNVYYIINKDNLVLDKLDKKYKKNMIYKDSFKHILYFFKCKRFIGTESIGHAMQLRVACKPVVDKLNSKKLRYVFLQHGVMYMVSLSSDLRTGFRRQNIKLHRIVVSSQKEADHFIELGGFEPEDLYICGLPKFDTAVRYPDADKIVIMPTWRRWEVNEAFEDYTKTKYFKMIQRIFNAIPKKLHDKVVLLPHPLMLDAIKNNDNYREYIPSGEFSYDEILKHCAVLITDYSSISYDAFYRGANVIFYWKEKDECMSYYGENAFLMLNEQNAFGDICYSSEDITNAVKNNYLKNQVIKYKNRYKKIVSFNDNKNTERLISMLIEDKIL